MKNELSPEIYKAIIDVLLKNSIFSVTDEKGNIIYVNDNFVKISQYSQDELLGQNHRILKSGHQPQEVFLDLWKTISDGKVWNGEIKNRAKDGTYYWVDATIVPILGEDKKPKNYAALRNVINNRKELEEKSKKYSENLERINKITVGRELKMIELKKEIKKMEETLAKLRE